MYHETMLPFQNGVTELRRQPATLLSKLRNSAEEDVERGIARDSEQPASRKSIKGAVAEVVKVKNK